MTYPLTRSPKLLDLDMDPCLLSSSKERLKRRVGMKANSRQSLRRTREFSFTCHEFPVF